MPGTEDDSKPKRRRGTPEYGYVVGVLDLMSLMASSIAIKTSSEDQPEAVAAAKAEFTNGCTSSSHSIARRISPGGCTGGGICMSVSFLRKLVKFDNIPLIVKSACRETRRSGEKLRVRSELFADKYSQARLFWKIGTGPHRPLLRL
jgi:hypothetical protein